MKCPNCQTEVYENSLYCPKCGQTINESSGKRDETDVFWKDVKIDTFEETKQKSKSKALIIIVILIVVIVAVVSFVCRGYFSSQNKLDEKATNTIVNEEEDNGNVSLENEETNSGIEEQNIDVEKEVLNIREKYNDITEKVKNDQCEKAEIADGVTGYYFNGDLIEVVVPWGIDGVDYTRYYYYDNNGLFFAYIEGNDAQRLYFLDQELIRWRYSENAEEAQNAINHDLESTEEYKNWSSFAISESEKWFNMENTEAIKMSNIVSASASSSLSENDMTHKPEYIMDGTIKKHGWKVQQMTE